MNSNGLYTSLFLTKSSYDPTNVLNKHNSYAIAHIRSLILLVFVMLPSIGFTASLKEEESKYYMNSLTQEAFRKIEPKLKAIKPDDTLDLTGIEWQFYKLKKWSKKKTIAVADGWVNGLSGRLPGAIMGLGKPTGISKDFIYGEHVFGYVWGNVNLIPRYLVITKAARITKSEYEKLEKKQTKHFGYYSVTIDGTKTNLYFHDVRVKEVKDLSGLSVTKLSPKEEAVIESLERKDIKKHLKSFVTLQKYEGVKPKIRRLRIGANTWAVIKALGGKFSTYNFGRRYVLEMDGYLRLHMKRSDYIWGKSRTDGKFIVEPYGYLDKGVPVPKIALIFKNNMLHSIVDNATKERVTKKLSEIE